jgi:heme oxygenase
VDERTTTPGLGELLREATRELHARVERSRLMSGLLRGKLSRADYCRLLRNLHEIYAALEAGLAANGASDPMLARLDLNGLARRAALEADLDALHGPGWRDGVALVGPALEYAARLRRLERESPALLVAHAYVRYLGDLSGGQVVRRVVELAYGLQGDAGTRFYAFGSPADATARALELRRAIASIPGDAPPGPAIVREAVQAFERHAALFDALAPAD